MNDEDLKKIQKLIKDELRPVKEATEIIQSKMSGFNLFERSTSITVRNLKDQLSVVNEKMDGIKDGLDNAKTALEEKIEQRTTISEQTIIKEISDFVDSHLLAQMDEKADKQTTDRLDNRLDQTGDKVNDHEVRIKKLESNSPAII